jgi:hypothetical protein
MRAIMRAVAKNSSGLLTVLALLFVALRLAGVTDWLWWWVLAPVWMPAVLGLVAVIAMVAMVAVVRLQAGRATHGALVEFASSEFPGSVVRVMRRRDVRRLLASGASGPSPAGAAGIPGSPDLGEILERYLRHRGWSPPEDPQ